MQNLIADFESSLWLESKPYFESLFENPLEKHFGEKAYKLYQYSSDGEYEEVIDPENLIVKLSKELSLKLNLPSCQVFRTSKRIESTISSGSGKDYSFIFYNQRILDLFTESDIHFGLLHEFGHIVYRPEKEPSTLVQDLFTKKTDQLIRLSTLLTHFTEFNADRFAVFHSKDLQGYITFLRKIHRIHKEIRESHENVNSTGIVFQSHPNHEDRIKALLCLEPFLHHDNFNINDDEGIISELMEITGYNAYKDLKRSLNN